MKETTGILHYFRWSFFFTISGILLGGWLGWIYTGTFSGIIRFSFICFVLALLEISLSFDNSIVNARILRNMSVKWQHRFLTWGMVMAVFGMRIIFPLVIVAIAAHLDPVSAFRLAIWNPQEYARIMMDAHTGIAAFGGTFLIMVGLKYFFDTEKHVHWIPLIERQANRFASLYGIEIALTLVFILIFSSLLHDTDGYTFLIAAICGLLTFLFVEALGVFLDTTQEQINRVHRGGAGTFMYLEVLDASFSFDGVIGAFALSTNLFIIVTGLGIGAFYVRSLTIMLVENKALGQYRYLEHGAFYAILTLAIFMYIQTSIHIPEVITGLIGVCLILAAFYSSICYNRRYRNRKNMPEQKPDG